MPEPTREQVTGVILAGGRGRRMGGRDKGLIPFHGRPMIAHVLEQLAPQVGPLLINANRNPARYAEFGHPLVADRLDGFQGPLAGILAAMETAPTPWLLTLPCDTPHVPPDLRRRMADALATEQAELAVAHDGTRLQAAHCLLPIALAPELAAYLESGERRVQEWLGRHGPAVVDFADQAAYFHNLNTPEELQQHER